MRCTLHGSYPIKNRVEFREINANLLKKEDIPVLYIERYQAEYLDDCL